jgi:hypothetical protein
VPFIKAARLVRRGDPLRFPGSAEAHTAGLP